MCGCVSVCVCESEREREVVVHVLGHDRRNNYMYSVFYHFFQCCVFIAKGILLICDTLCTFVCLCVCVCVRACVCLSVWALDSNY